VACRGVVYGNILSNLLPLSFGSIIGNALARTHKSTLGEIKELQKKVDTTKELINNQL